MVDRHFGSLTMEDKQGDGCCVVMVHGLGGSSNTFEPLMPALKDNRVIRVDVPGAARSALRPSARSIIDLSQAVEEALRANQIRRAFIVAHSMGTLLAQHIAAKSIINVSGMLLFGAMTEPATTARQALMQRATTALSEGMSGIAESVADNSLSAMSKQKIPVATAFIRESLMRQDPRAYASHCLALADCKAVNPDTISCPVTLVTGEQDVVTPPSMARQLHTGLLNSELKLLPNIGHWPTIEASQKCQSLLLRALNKRHSPHKPVSGVKYG